jgi:hypothetical protein
MTTTITDLANWPTKRDFQPILNSTKEALLYAQLIHRHIQKQTDLASYRELTYKLLSVERRRPTPDLQRMMNLAVRAQLFRECLEECQRITNDKSNH